MIEQWHETAKLPIELYDYAHMKDEKEYYVKQVETKTLIPFFTNTHRLHDECYPLLQLSFENDSTTVLNLSYFQQFVHVRTSWYTYLT